MRVWLETNSMLLQRLLRRSSSLLKLFQNLFDQPKRAGRFQDAVSRARVYEIMYGLCMI